MKIIRQFTWRPAPVIALIATLSLTACGGGGGAGSGTVASSSSKSSAVASSSSSSSSAASSTSSLSATSTYVTFDAPALANNLIGEPTTRGLRVYLPKAYYEAENQLFPVIYYLPGFGDWTMLGVAIPGDLEQANAALNPAIVVIVDGRNAFDGSFYVNSPVTGNWGDYVSKDVVDYIDAHYRSIPNRRARGVAGHSMGGFGALDLAMRHPEVFGSVFAMAPGLVGAKGIVDTQMFDSYTHISNFLASLALVNKSDSVLALNALHQNPDQFDIAYGMAFAPSLTPPYFEYPYSLDNTKLVSDAQVLAKWESGFGAIHSEVAEFATNLESLNGIGIDCGLNDEYAWIPRGCSYYDAELAAANITHSYTTHSGSHQNRLRERILQVMLPFFSQHLATE